MQLTEYQKQHYRELAPDELALQRETVEWLLKKGVAINQAKTLTLQRLDREQGIATIHYETKRWSLNRRLPYLGTPLERQADAARELQRSSLFVFPKLAWTGREPNYCPAWRETELKALIKKNRHKFIWTWRRNYANLESTKGSRTLNIKTGAEMNLEA